MIHLRMIIYPKSYVELEMLHCVWRMSFEAWMSITYVLSVRKDRKRDKFDRLPYGYYISGHKFQRFCGLLHLAGIHFSVFKIIGMFFSLLQV